MNFDWPEQERKTPSEILDNMTLFDDDLMSKVFDNNIAAANLLLRIILEDEGIEVISVEGQKELENPLVEGRNICLDIFAQDRNGKYHDIEVQRKNSGAGAQRARFHSAMLDSRMLKQKEQFRDIADSYVIFITEKDVIGFGDPIYRIDRTIRGHQTLFGDGSHILYVNGQYQGNDPVGKLIHDFWCKEPNDMYYDTLAQSVKHYKDNEGGRAVMCEAVEEYGRQQAEEQARKTAIYLHSIGMELETIVKAVAQPVELVQLWIAGAKKN